MSDRPDTPAPAWVEPFLAVLAGSPTIKEAALRSGISPGAVYGFKDRHAWFRDRVAATRGVPAAPARAWGETRIDRFLEALAETSNVRAAAAAAELTLSQIYHRRRTDPSFARRWYAALAEGYDNLEMELLWRLRAGDSADGESSGKKFDTATALRCLTAHRESVAREKGRRTLAAEVTTIASINAKIDAMRLKQEDTQKAIAKVRKTKAPKINPPRHCEEPQAEAKLANATRQSMDRALDITQQSRLAQAVGLGLPRHPCGVPRNDDDMGKRSDG